MYYYLLVARIANENSLSISDMFPIKTEQDLNQLENNLKDIIYRNNAVI